MSAAATIDTWLRERLACPRDHSPLSDEHDVLVCAHGHRYPCVDGIPVFVLKDVRQTHWIADYSLDEPEAGASVEMTDGIDPFVREAVGATCGNFYGATFAATMAEYPIPALPMAPLRAGEVLLDVGCSWGRWTVAATRAGFRAVGVDPSLIAVRAARRVAAQLRIDANFVVGDARHLPFAASSFGTVFSYSVLQHFEADDAIASAREMSRVLEDGGRAKVQLATAFGVRNLVQQARRGFAPPRDFQVRYWRPSAIVDEFERSLGPCRLEADSYFSLNAQITDARLLPPLHRTIVRVSDWLCRRSARAPWLVPLADSVYVHATRA